MSSIKIAFVPCTKQIYDLFPFVLVVGLRAAPALCADSWVLPRFPFALSHYIIRLSSLLNNPNNSTNERLLNETAEVRSESGMKDYYYNYNTLLYLHPEKWDQNRNLVFSLSLPVVFKRKHSLVLKKLMSLV